jgi:hypothetical protein
VLIILSRHIHLASWPAVRSGQHLDEFPQRIAALKGEITWLKGDFAQTIAEAVACERQRQLSEEVTILKSLVFPQLDFKIPTDFPPIFADSNEDVNFLRLAQKSRRFLRVFLADSDSSGYSTINSNCL